MIPPKRYDMYVCMYLEEAKKIEDADKTSFTEKSAVLNHVM
jgi:hypothetical protein